MNHNPIFLKWSCALLLLTGSACGSSDATDADDTGNAGNDSSEDEATSDDGDADESTPDTDVTGPGDVSDDNADDVTDPGDVSDDSADTSDAGFANELSVELGAAGDFAILAKSAISTVPTSAITGDMGVSPAAATFITGFSLTADATNLFATASQVTGRIYAADYTSPSSSMLTTAVADMETAYTDAAGRAPDDTELGAGNIGGLTLSAGVYKWGTGLLIPSDLTLSGSATDVWVFQIAQDLLVSSSTNVLLANGALPKNVFWQVAGLVELGSTARFAGIVLAQTSITLGTGASINGRLLAQTAVSLDSNVIVQPTR